MHKREITIDDILLKIKKEVERRNLSNSPDMLDFSDILTEINSSNDNMPIQDQVIRETRLYKFMRKVQQLLLRLKIYKFFAPVTRLLKRLIPNKLKYQKGFKINSFLEYEDKYFVINAYKIILGRDPDENGLADNLKNLRDNFKDKIEILMYLRNSQEGKKKNICIYGLKRKYLIHKIGKFINKFPVIGYILRIIFSIIFLPSILEKKKKSKERILTNILYEIEQLNKYSYEKNEEFFSRLDSIEKSFKEQANTDILEIMDKINKDINTIDNKYSNMLDNTFSKIDDVNKKITDLSILVNPKPDHSLDALYASFENEFRGTRKDIKERLKVYLPYIENINSERNSLSIIDLGCGRGEWLELLGENGYDAKGIDLNNIMIKECKEHNLNVEESDAIEFLINQKADSFDIITGFQIVEHLSLRTLISLFDECLRTLRTNGMVIFETPNPENIIVGSCNFYNDLTHIRPIHPDTLEFLLKSCGFTKLKLLKLHPLGYFDFDYKKDDPMSSMAYRFNMEQDYSVLAVKR